MRANIRLRAKGAEREKEGVQREFDGLAAADFGFPNINNMHSCALCVSPFV